MAPLTINGNTIDPHSAESGYFPSDASLTNFILLRAEHYLDYYETLELQARGAEVQSLVEANDRAPTYLCKFEPSDLTILEALPFVKHAFVYHQDFVLHPRLKADDLAHPASGVETKQPRSSEGWYRRLTGTHHTDEVLCEVNIGLHRDTVEHGNDVFEELRKALPADSGLEKVHSSSGALRAWVPASMLPTVAAMDHVISVHPALKEGPFTIRARGILGLPASNWTQGVFQYNDLAADRYEGTGEVVAVSDTGLDTAKWASGIKEVHPGFIVTAPSGVKTSRIANTANNSTIGTNVQDLADTDGHGTHVAGCVLGVYSAKTTSSDDSISAGMAPGAKVFVQYYHQESFEDRATQLRTSGLGITIQNNSWGTFFNKKTREQPSYSDVPVTIDNEVWNNNKSLLIVFAAGNDGEELLKYPALDTAIPVNRQIGGQASAKNVLTVGASWSGRSMAADSRANMTYNDNDCIEGRPFGYKRTGSGVESSTSIASFSSKGPTYNNLLKPDVVAPGIGILSTYSRTWAAWRQKPRLFASSACSYPELAYLSGTSMAAPIVSGVAACLKEASIAVALITPSGQTLKAILVNGAESCAGGSFWYVTAATPTKTFARGILGRPPDCIQGHGRVSYTRSLEHIIAMGPPNGSSTNYAGFWEHPTGIRAPPVGVVPPTPPYERWFVVRPGHQKICVTLVYHDPGNPLLQNILKLKATLEEFDIDDALVREVGFQDPDPPQAYPAYSLSGDPTAPVAATDIELGNVQKVTWATPVPVVAADHVLKVKMTVTPERTTRTNPVGFSLAWLSEP